MAEPANDDGTPIHCGTCGHEGELTVAGGALRVSEGFAMVDGLPVCSCGGAAGISLANMPGGHGFPD